MVTNYVGNYPYILFFEISCPIKQEVLYRTYKAYFPISQLSSPTDLVFINAIFR